MEDLKARLRVRLWATAQLLTHPSRHLSLWLTHSLCHHCWLRSFI